MSKFIRRSRDKLSRGRCGRGKRSPRYAICQGARISVITTKRAYDELEKEGFLNTVAGKGCFVSEENTELIREANLKEIESLMERILSLAATCGLNSDDLLEMFRYFMKGE